MHGHPFNITIPGMKKKTFDTCIDFFPSIKGLHDSKLGDMWHAIATTTVATSNTSATVLGIIPTEDAFDDKDNSTNLRCCIESVPSNNVAFGGK